MMSLFDTIQNYRPGNQQEEHDKDQMLQFLRCNKIYLERENQTAHFTASMWTVNKERTKALMVYHNLYNSWSWIGGHADGMENLCAVAWKELQEETGVKHAKLVSEEIFSLETLTVNGHIKKGIWVPSHLHFNLTFLAEAEEDVNAGRVAPLEDTFTSLRAMLKERSNGCLSGSISQISPADL